MDELQTRILAYQPNTEAKNLLKESQLLLLVGPTGSGKNALEQQLFQTGRFRPIVTHTSRAPRINHGVLEKDGDEYHFVSTKEAIDMLKKHRFIEAAFTHGHLYGTSTDELKAALREGKIAVADIDIKGVRVYRQLSPKIKSVFLVPPSFKILLQRLINRYAETHNQEDILVRLGTALDELSELINTDYYYALVNDDMSETTKKVLDIVDGVRPLKANHKALKLAQKLIDDIKDYLDQQ